MSDGAASSAERKTHPSGDPRFGQLEELIAGHGGRHSALIQVLHRAQSLFGFLSQDVLTFVAQRMRLPLSRIHGVVSFYHFFTTVPQGKHCLMVCTGTACYVKGADRLLERLQTEFGIKAEQTTPDTMFTLKTARCLGACSLAPVVVVDDEVMGKVDTTALLRQLKKIR